MTVFATSEYSYPQLHFTKTAGGQWRGKSKIMEMGNGTRKSDNWESSKSVVKKKINNFFFFFFLRGTLDFHSPCHFC